MELLFIDRQSQDGVFRESDIQTMKRLMYECRDAGKTARSNGAMALQSHPDTGFFRDRLR